MAKQIGGTHRLELDYAGTRIGIGSDDGATLAWLEEFLSPAFGTTIGGAGDYSITFNADVPPTRDSFSRPRRRISP